MTDTDTEILLSKFTNWIERDIAANRIIKIFDAEITKEEIIFFFSVARKNIYKDALPKSRIKFLVDTLLKNNKNMFIAVIKGFTNDCINYYLSILVGYKDKKITLGHDFSFEIVEIYCKLLNHNDFDINDLVIEENQKLIIQQYKQEKFLYKFKKMK